MVGSLAVVLTPFLLWTTPVIGLSSTANSHLAFEAGGVKLEPQDLPEFLYPYHTRSLEMAESLVFTDPSSLSCTRAVRYGPMDHQLLDVWTSSSSSSSEASNKEEDGEGGKRGQPKNVPVVVMIHGGGWDWGYREWVSFCAKSICGDGRAVMIAPSYSLGKGKARAWPQSRDDVVQALLWTVENIGKYGGDPAKVVIAGHSAGGHLAACVGLDRELLETPVDGRAIDPDIVKALFLISCPLGVRAEDFFPPKRPKWLWRITLGPVTRFLYRRSILKFLRPVVGDCSKGTGPGKNSRKQTEEYARAASPLYWLAERKTKRSSVKQPLPPPPSQPFVHYSYATKKDFPICRPHSKSLADILGTENVEILEMAGVEGHFDSHFALADPTSEWHDALTKTLSSI